MPRVAYSRAALAAVGRAPTSPERYLPKGNNAFGFQLRNDNNRPARAGMLDLLRDAFDHNWTVVIDYNIDAGKANGLIIRTALTK